MKKNIIIVFLGVLLFGVLLFFNYVQKAPVIQKEILNEKTSKKKKFPKLDLFNLEGGIVFFENLIKKKEKTLLILFNPLCEDCVDKLKYLSDSDSMQEKNIILIGSLEKKDTVTNLLNQIDFSNFNSIHTILTHNSISDSIQVYDIPTMLLYSNEEGLLQIDNGIRFKKIAQIM